MKSLGDRMKEYENVFYLQLPKRMPVIVRLDGKAFHTFTKRFVKPFDIRMEELMEQTAYKLVDNVQNCILAYYFSD